MLDWSKIPAVSFSLVALGGVGAHTPEGQNNNSGSTRAGVKNSTNAIKVKIDKSEGDVRCRT